MNKHRFLKWEPVSGIPETLYLEGLYDDYEGFRLLLNGKTPDSNMLRVLFESALTYRNIDEGDYLKMISEAEGMTKWGLYILNESEYIDWFMSQSYDSYASEGIKHYAIYTPNDCVEILSEYPPKVEWLNE